ncbi:MAG: hypothetical protein RL701_7982 [Pseudomonadota bacterium]|jgi:hypothetical protein
MTRANPKLIWALRTTAARLLQGAPYRWTHMGACNCGHLAQTVTHMTADAIRRYALERAGEWAEQGIEYCPTSGYPIDAVLKALFDLGLTSDDLGELEKLSNPAVLRRLPVDVRTALSYRERDHVVLYMRTLAEWLEEQLQASTLAPPVTLEAEYEHAKRVA